MTIKISLVVRFNLFSFIWLQKCWTLFCMISRAQCHPIGKKVRTNLSYMGGLDLSLILVFIENLPKVFLKWTQVRVVKWVLYEIIEEKELRKICEVSEEMALFFCIIQLIEAPFFLSFYFYFLKHKEYPLDPRVWVEVKFR